MRPFRDLPMRRKLALLIVGSGMASLLFAAVPLIAYDWLKARDAARSSLSTATRIAADNVTAALMFRDASAAHQILSSLRAEPDVDSACLYGVDPSSASALFADFAVRGACPGQPEGEGLHEDSDGTTLVQAVTESRDRIGWLRVRKNRNALSDALATQMWITLGILGLSFLLGVAIAFPLQQVLADPLLRLASLARRVSESRDYALRADKQGADELGQLVDDFNQMLEQIALREGQLQQARQALEAQVTETTAANVELQGALQRLKQAQAELVQTERLASLGGMVAGVAHEINTPVGIGVTAASTLQSHSIDVQKAYETEELTRSDLERFLAISRESSDIILRNLQRAADLIQSFKQVAVDQTSGERRRFAMKTYLEEVLLSLAPRLRRAGHKVEVTCPPELLLDSYPGALAQIIANFVGNSLLHGYDEGRTGNLRIDVAANADWTTLVYSDDGKGIPPEHLGRVFDPFFTTRRGTGGSGLGLHIVFNLVTQLLGGTIDVRSEAGRGARFTIRFPSVARRRAAA